MTYLLDIHLFADLPVWQREGWWEIRCECGCGIRWSALTAREVRYEVRRMLPGQHFTIIEHAGLRECWREIGRIDVRREGRTCHVLPLPIPRKIQHKGV